MGKSINTEGIDNVKSRTTLVIIGASGQGKVVADIAEKMGYSNIMFLDDNTDIKHCGAYEVVGDCNCVDQYSHCDFIVAIGNSTIRRRIQLQLIEKRLHIVSLIHPAATVSDNVEIGVGTVIMAGAVVNPYVKIGQGSIINTCASVDHDCEIGEFVHISVGAHIAGKVHVGDNTWIGIGAIVSNNLGIATDCTIGAGAVVISNINESGVYIGLPARRKNSKDSI